MPGRVLLDTSVVIALSRGDEVVADKLKEIDILPCDRLTAEVYSRLKHGLPTEGRPIPDNDPWVAATAVRYGLVLASRDEHFGEIAELQQERR